MSPTLMRLVADDLSAGITTGHDWPNSQDELTRLQCAKLLREAADELESNRAAPAPAGEPVTCAWCAANLEHEGHRPGCRELGAAPAGEPVAWMNPSIEPPMFIAHWAKVDHGAVFTGGGYTAAYTIPLYVAAPAGEPPPMKTWQHDETGRICRLERSPGPRWAEVPSESPASPKGEAP